MCVCVQDSDSVELEGLRGDRSYIVELQSVSYWEQLPLKSSKATLRFSTQQAKTGAQFTYTSFKPSAFEGKAEIT